MLASLSSMSLHALTDKIEIAIFLFLLLKFLKEKKTNKSDNFVKQ